MSLATARPLLLDGVLPLIPWLFGPLPAVGAEVVLVLNFGLVVLLAARVLGAVRWGTIAACLLASLLMNLASSGAPWWPS